MADSLEAQISAWVKELPQRQLAVFQTAVQRTIEMAQTPISQGGNMPVDTGFLRASGQVVIGDDVPGELAPNPNPGVGAFTYDAGPVNLVIAGAKLGDTISFAYTANYAVFQNYGARGQPGHHFVDLAVQAWPQTVAVCAEAEKRGTR